MTAAEKGRILTAKRQELFNLQSQYKTDRVHPTLGVPVYEYADGVEQEIDKRLSELAVLTDEYKALADSEVASENEKQLASLQNLERKYFNPGSGTSVNPGTQQARQEFKSLGHYITDSPQFKLRANNKNEFAIDIPGIDIKTLLTTAGTPGYVPANPRTDLVVPYPLRPLRVVDLIPITPTGDGIIYWMEQTTHTSNASMTGEGYVKPESTYDWDQQSSTVRKIAHVATITDEIMNDVPGFMSFLNNDMVYDLGVKEEQQVLLGSGIGQEFTGILSHGSLQTQAFSTNNADTIMKAITKVSWTGYGNVTAIIMHPANWETIRLLKGATNQDYVLGSPLIDVTPRLWGVPVVVTNAITQNTALVGDFSRYVEIRRREGVRVETSNQHDVNFTTNKITIRAEMREALLIKRGSAFCSATSLT